MNFLTLLLTALGLAMDAFSVAVSSGIFIKNFKPRYAIKVGLFFGFFQFLMPVIGWSLGCGFSAIISKFAPWIAFGLLGFIGIKMLIEAINPNTEEVQNPLDNKMLTIMSIATSIDALAVGVTFAAMGMSAFGLHIGNCTFINSAIIGLVSFILSSAGVYIGHESGDLFGNKAEIVGGIVLIGIGIKILLESFI